MVKNEQQIKQENVSTVVNLCLPSDVDQENMIRPTVNPYPIKRFNWNFQVVQQISLHLGYTVETCLSVPGPFVGPVPINNPD